MSAELIATGFVMGLAGAAHCTAMCGAACAALTPASMPEPAARPTGPGAPGTQVTWLRVAAQPGAAAAVPLGATLRSTGASLGPFLAARVASYATGGAIVAASVAALAGLGQQVAMLRPVWTLLHVAIVVLGLWLLVTGRQPAWLGALRIGAGPSAPTAGWRSDPRWRPVVAGAAWVAMPCGLLQSALVVAALADGAAGGAAVMAAFAVASSAGLIAAPGAHALLRRLGGAGGDRAVTRIAGAMLVGASAWALWLLATMGANAAVCVV